MVEITSLNLYLNFMVYIHMFCQLKKFMVLHWLSYDTARAQKILISYMTHAEQWLLCKMFMEPLGWNWSYLNLKKLIDLYLQVLGDLQFHFYHRWFDVIFLVSAVSTLAILYLVHQQSSNKEKSETFLQWLWTFITSCWSANAVTSLNIYYICDENIFWYTTVFYFYFQVKTLQYCVAFFFT